MTRHSDRSARVSRSILPPNRIRRAFVRNFIRNIVETIDRVHQLAHKAILPFGDRSISQLMGLGAFSIAVSIPVYAVDVVSLMKRMELPWIPQLSGDFRSMSHPEIT